MRRKSFNPPTVAIAELTDLANSTDRDDNMGRSLPIQRQSFIASLLDHLPRGLDHEHRRVHDECLQQHHMGERLAVSDRARVSTRELLVGGVGDQEYVHGEASPHEICQCGAEWIESWEGKGGR
jgi:hypothetical protein